MNYKLNMGGTKPQWNSMSSKQSSKPNMDCPPVCDQSIFFSGLCNGDNFDVSKRMWTELSINGTICIPCEKPLIEQIDSINAKTEIMSIKVIETPGLPNLDNPVDNYEGRLATGRKLIVEGLICLTVSYVSICKDQSVHSFHGKVPFSAFIVIPRKLGRPEQDTLTLNFMVSSCIEDVCVKSIQNRLVNVTTTFLLSASQVVNSCSENYFEDSGIDCRDSVDCASCEDQQAIVFSGVCPPEKLRKLLNAPNQGSLRYWNEISVPEVLTIPSFKPDVEQILSVNSKVEIMCQKVIATPIATAQTNLEKDITKIPSRVNPNGVNLANLKITGRKLIIEAILRQRITYVSATDCQSVHSAHFDIPISTYIMVPQTTLLTDKFKIIPCIEDIYACILNPRQIFKNTTLFFKACPINTQ